MFYKLIYFVLCSIKIVESGFGDVFGNDFFGVEIKVNLDNNEKSVIIVNLF